MQILSVENEKVMERLLRYAGSSSILEQALQTAPSTGANGVKVEDVIRRIRQLKSKSDEGTPTSKEESSRP